MDVAFVHSSGHLRKNQETCQTVFWITSLLFSHFVSNYMEYKKTYFKELHLVSHLKYEWIKAMQK